LPEFGTASLRKLTTLHPLLQLVLRTAIQDGPDFTIISAKRTLEEQHALLAEGASRTLKSKHLMTPSEAVDIAPWPVDWNDTTRFYILAGYVLGIAARLGVPLRWGGDWNGNWSYRDQRFHDLPHFELDDEV
jgi:peptidoglycan L-alanyl-D-glutamate endopeptidase CwlK